MCLDTYMILCIISNTKSKDERDGKGYSGRTYSYPFSLYGSHDEISRHLRSGSKMATT